MKPHSRPSLAFALGLALTLLLADVASAQQPGDKTPERGFQPGGSYALSDIETLNTTNGNLILNVPLAALPAGRGNSPGAALRLYYNSKLYDSRVERHVGLGGPIGGDDCTSPDGWPIPCDQSRLDRGRDPRFVDASWNGVRSFVNAQDNSYDYTMNLLQASNSGGWHYGYSYQLTLHNRFDQYTNGHAPDCNSDEYVYHWKLKMTFPDGSEHEFRPTNFGQSPTLFDGYTAVDPNGRLTGRCTSSWASTTGMTYYSTDGTYARLRVEHDSDGHWWNNAWTLSLPDGTRVTGGNAPQRVYDRNNNYTEVQVVTLANGHSATKVVDQLGRHFLIEHGAAPDEDHVITYGPNGQEVRWRIRAKTVWTYRRYTATQDFPLPSGVSPERELFVSHRVVDQIILPSQAGSLAYTFSYNGSASQPLPGNYTAGWGELSSVTLPTGAQSAYQYVLDNQQHLATIYTDVLQNSPTRKDLTYQKEYEDDTSTATETWHYDISTVGSRVTGPDGGVAQEFFANTQQGGFDAGLAYKSVRPDGTVVERIWKRNTPANTEADNPYVKTEFTSVRDASGNLTKTAIKDYNYDKNGNLTHTYEYDWVGYASVARDASGKPTGVPGGAPLRRVTTNAYHVPTPDAYDTWSQNGNTYVYNSATALRNAVASTEVGDGSQTLARTEFAYDSPMSTGNLTLQKSWDSTKGGYSNPLHAGNSVSVSHQYDSYGNRWLSTDARGVQTHLTFGSVGGHTALYPTETCTAHGTGVQRTTTNQYDFQTGLVTATTDTDNGVSTSTTYDALGRPTLVREAEGKAEERRTATEYHDAARRVVTRVDLDSAGDAKLVSVQHYDRLGRLRLARKLEDAAAQSVTDETAGIKVQTRYRYSGAHSFQLVSNPYCAASAAAAGSEQTMGWSLTKLNSGGRVVEIQTFAGGSSPAPFGPNTNSTGLITTAYDAEFTTVMDQADRKRRNAHDALGRLIRVDEPDAGNNLGPTSAPVQQTSYAYDPLANLKQVTQGGQTRGFVYSSLSRLLSASTPESGTVSFVYDNNGGVTQKTDARGVQTNFSYDALNRVTSKTYTDATPPVAYYYDAQSLPAGAPAFDRGHSRGRLVAVTYGGASAGNYTGYDALGRALRRVQQTDSVNYLTEATYNRAGAVETETYPAVPGHASRRAVTYSFDGAGRLSALSSVATTYAAGASLTVNSYAPQGDVARETYGNQMVRATDFNARLQPVEIRLGTSAAPASALRLTYDYGTSDNNGNVRAFGYSGGGLNYAQTYSYDSLNRLQSAQETSGGLTRWTQTNGFDRFGNRWEALPGGPSLTFDASNRIDGRSYDAAGNLLNDGFRSHAYDAENRLKTVDGLPAYQYDGNGQRVRKFLSENLRMVYDVSGRLIAEFDGATGALKKEYIYGPGGLAATVEPAGGTVYMTSDPLGSPRVLTNAGGGVVSRHDYIPFGQELTAGAGERLTGQGYGAADGLRQRFAGKERDSETGLDYFGARYYSSAAGRFTSADPVGVNPSRLVDPQQLNRYAYVRNNPLKYHDPDGRDIKLDPKLQPADADRLVKAIAGTYCKPDGKQVIDAMKKSEMTFVYGDDRLRDRQYPDGTKERVYGVAAIEPGPASKANAQGTAAVYIDTKATTVYITLDLKKLGDDRASFTMVAPSDQTVMNHEHGHAKDIMADPVRAYNASAGAMGLAGFKEYEKSADAFGARVSAQEATMSQEEAEKQVRGMLGLTPPAPAPVVKPKAQEKKN